ncbi:hypothetical protein [Streptomyces sp. NPDC053427]|uniref:hypothetical protein n=1 Tax=Streptomyces sp. NPDC053427 TaxID=3365701 RepID=UPI0037CD84A2
MLPVEFPEFDVSERSASCPECGSSSPPEARFCMGCGRERQAAAPPAPGGPPPPPPPVQPPVPAAPPGRPPYAAPAAPSPLGAFLGRTMRGDWLAALKVAAWPTLMLLLLACVLGIFSSDDMDEAGLGWGVRMRCFLALLLQSVGGGVTLSGSATGPLGRFGEGLNGEMSVSLVPLVVTGLWVTLLAVAARKARRAAASAPAGIPGTAVPRASVRESVLRIAVLCGAGTLALGLLAQPSYDGMELSSAAWRALLCSFLLAAVVSGAVLARDEARAWLAPRPGWRITLNALRTALLALVTVVLLAGLVAFVAILATADDVTGGDAVALLVLLPNLGAIALALAWGAPVNAEWNVPGLPFLDSGRQSIGYSELGRLGGDWALFGIIVGGLVCALLVGFLTVRRSADRREQLLAAGFFVVALVLAVWAAGATVSASLHAGGSGSGLDGGYGGQYGGQYGGDYGGGYGGEGDSRLAAHGELAAGGAETLLFALLWTFGAALLAPYLRMMVGRGNAAAPAAPAAPYGAPAASPAAPGMPPAPATGPLPAVPPTPAAPPAPADGPAAAPAEVPANVPANVSAEGLFAKPAPEAAPTPPATPAVTPAPLEEPRPARRRAVKWVSMALIAFLVGGGATAGALYYKNHRAGAEDHKAPKKPAVAKSGGPTGTPAPSATPSPTASPASPSATPSPDAGLPAGFERKDDPYGFSLGVMHGWQRSVKGTQVDYKAPTGSSYLRIGVIADAPQSSYDNFLSMEKHAKKRTNYQRTELKRNAFQKSDGARWEFTYVNDTGNTIHAIDQAYVAADGTEYSIYYECLDSLYDPANDKVFSTALGTWAVSATDVD